MWTLPEPMLAAPVRDPSPPRGWAAEVKWDGFRAMLSVDAGRTVLRSRRGADLCNDKLAGRYEATVLVAVLSEWL